MPTLVEELAAATSKLDSLALDGVGETVDLAQIDVLQGVLKELDTKPTQARCKELGTLLAQVSKAVWEGTNSTMQIKIVNDPMRVQEGTERIATIQTLNTLPPTGSFFTNWGSSFTKAEVIAKVLQHPEKLAEVIEKSKLTESMDNIKSTFGLTDDDMVDEYSIRWKIGDLVGALQTAVKVERLTAALAKSGGDEKPAEDPNAPKPDENKPEEKPPEVPNEPKPGEQKLKPSSETVWPADMAAATLDTVTKGYKKPELAWGQDAKASRR